MLENHDDWKEWEINPYTTEIEQIVGYAKWLGVKEQVILPMRAESRKYLSAQPTKWVVGNLGDASPTKSPESSPPCSWLVA